MGLARYVMNGTPHGWISRSAGLSCLLGVAVAGAVELPVIESRNAPPRDHVLFVGTAVSVLHEGVVVPVRRIRGRAVELDNGERTSLRLGESAGLQLQPTTRVSAAEVRILELAVERCFSPSADPNRRQLQNQLELQEYAAGRADAAESLLRKDAQPQNADAGRSPDEVRAQEKLLESGDIMTGFSNSQQLAAELWSEATRTGPTSGPARPAPDFDAVRLRCMVSATVPLRDVQAVVVIRMAKAGEFADLSFAHTIGDIGTSPRPIEILRPGIPAGYAIKDSRLHLFVRTEEVPTNLSEKRFAVTAEEAREYLRLLHLDQYRGEDAAAEPAWSLVPPALLGREDGRDLDFPVTVDLDERGRLLGVHEEAVVVPAAVREVLGEIVFLPALREGVPVAASVTVNLADFFR